MDSNVKKKGKLPEHNDNSEAKSNRTEEDVASMLLEFIKMLYNRVDENAGATREAAVLKTIIEKQEKHLQESKRHSKREQLNNRLIALLVTICVAIACTYLGAYLFDKSLQWLVVFGLFFLIGICLWGISFKGL